MYRHGTRIERPFSLIAEVVCRACSQPLQRVITDFGADEAFGRVPGKLQEHYGVAIPVSTIQRLTERHAQRCYEAESERAIPAKGAGSDTFIGEMDGSMVPVVEISADAQDKRCGKTLLWKEVRLCLVHKVGQVAPVFGGHFAGGVTESGRQWERCAVQAGFGLGSHLHAVGDGASWIADQVEDRFGAQGSYLVDFYHLCEYLGEAAKVCAPANADTWMEAQKQCFKANQAASVLTALEPFVEATGDGPVTACARYIRNRWSQLDYQGALARGLPIGSGEIESAHRYIIQKRLKLPGAWWTPNHIEAMLALRIKRANGEWDSLWTNSEKQAA